MTALTAIKRRIQGQTFEGQTHIHLDLSSMLAYGSIWRDCQFVDCDFTLADLRSAKFERVKFTSCVLHAVNFSGSEMRGVFFDSCRMKQAVLAGIHPLERVTLEDCQAQYASFADSTLRDVSFVRTNLHGADLRFMENHKAMFDDCNLWGALISLNCALFGDGVSFDERSVNLFMALIARKHPDEKKRVELEEMAGTAVAVVDRLVAAPEG